LCGIVQFPEGAAWRCSRIDLKTNGAQVLAAFLSLYFKPQKSSTTTLGPRSSVCCPTSSDIHSKRGFNSWFCKFLYPREISGSHSGANESCVLRHIGRNPATCVTSKKTRIVLYAFLALSKNCEKLLLASSCLPSWSSAWNKSAPTERTVTKFDIRVCFEKSVEKIRVSLNI
jgi:hypothetical protein